MATRTVRPRAGFDFGELEQFAKSDPRDVLGALRAVTSEVETVGSEQLRGVETTHYRATVDPAELAKLASGKARTGPQSLVDQLSTQAGVGPIPGRRVARRVWARSQALVVGRGHGAEYVAVERGVDVVRALGLRPGGRDRAPARVSGRRRILPPQLASPQGRGWHGTAATERTPSGILRGRDLRERIPVLRQNGLVVSALRRARRGDDPRARADPARRRGHVPRLRRRRLDVPLARARRARLPRLRGARGPRAARRGVRRGRRVLPRRARRRGRRDERHASQGSTEAELREIRYRATRAAAAGDRATRPPTRSRRSSTGSSRAATRRASSAKREDGVVRPLLDVWREETVRYCEEHGLDYRNDSSNADTKRGLIRDEILPLLRRLHPGAERNLLALADERPRLPRELERTLVELLASTGRDEAADLGGGVRAVREYGERACSRAAVRFGPWRIETAARARGAHAAAGRPPRGPEQEGPGPLRRREGAARRARRLAARRLAATRSSPFPGVAVAPGWEDTVRAWKDAEQ